MSVSEEQMREWLMKNLGPQSAQSAFPDYPKTGPDLAEAAQRQQNSLVTPTALASNQSNETASDVPSTNIEGTDTDIVSKMPSIAQSNFPEIQQSPSMQAFSPQALAQAQQTANQNNFQTGVLGSIANAVGTMTHTPTNSQTWKDLQGQANQPLTNLAQQQAQVKGQISAQELIGDSDPNSEQSKSFVKAANSIMQKSGIDIDLSGRSEAEAVKLMKVLGPEVVQSAKILAAQGKASKTSEDKSSNYNEVDAKQLRKDLDVNRASSRSSVGRASTSVAAANKLLNAFAKKDPESLNEQQIYEIVKDVDSMLAPSGATITGAEHLMPPHAALDSLNDFKSWFTRQPYGAQKGAYVRQFLAIGDRIKQASIQNLDKEMDAFVDKESRFYKNAPDRYNAIVKGFRDSVIRGDEYNENGPAGGGGSKNVGPHGASVTQKGVKYNWNPNTGKYE